MRGALAAERQLDKSASKCVGYNPAQHPANARAAVLQIESDLPFKRFGDLLGIKSGHAEQIAAEFACLVDALERPRHFNHAIVGDCKFSGLEHGSALLVEEAAIMPQRAILGDEAVEETSRRSVNGNIREHDPPTRTQQPAHLLEDAQEPSLLRISSKTRRRLGSW